MKYISLILTLFLISCNDNGEKLEAKNTNIVKASYVYPKDWNRNIKDPEINDIVNTIAALENAIDSTKSKASMDEINDEVLTNLDKQINIIKLKYNSKKTSLNSEINKLDEKIKKLRKYKLINQSKDLD